MSSENLTTNANSEQPAQPELIPSVETPVSETKTTETVANPLEEKPTRLNFKVDQLGLNKPISQVPDDVKYFIDKQQGKFDSKYNFIEGFLKATTLDNFAVVAYNKGAEVIKSGLNPFELDDNYRVTKEQFDVIETYPQHMQDAFLEAKSESHFYHIKKQADERLEIENEISKLGWGGIGARMLAATIDPANVALSVASAGLVAPIIYGTKAERLRRAVKLGAIVGTENALIESGLYALDPLKNEEDIKYAYYGGFLLGAPFGALGRVPKEIQIPYKKMHVEASKILTSQSDAESVEFANLIKGNVSEDVLRRRRLEQGEAKNKYDFTITDNPKLPTVLDDNIDNIAKVEQEFRSGTKKFFGFLPIPRLSMSASLNKSQDPLIRKWVELAVPDPIVGSSSGDTMLEFKERTLTAILGDYQKTREVAFRSWKKLNKDNTSMNPHLNNERFNELMTDFIENPEMLVNSKSITKEMQLHGNYASRAFDEVLSVAAKSGREGWDEIAKSRKILKYVPHVHSKVKVIDAINEYGIDQVRSVYANAIKDFKPRLGEKVFNRMINGIVDTISSNKYYGRESMFSKAFQGTNDASLREFFQDLDLDKKQIDEIFKQIKKPKGNTLDTNANKRIPFDFNARVDVRSVRDGKVRSLSLKDLSERNLEKLITRYSNQVVGQAAMARFGGFKNNSEFDAFLNRLRENNKFNTKYEDFEDHMNMIEVVAASFLGRQNPLEARDPTGQTVKRIARLIGDYNFLRLFGQVGFAQGSELYSALAEAGWTTALKSMPQLNSLFSRVKSGDIKVNDPLIRELESYGVATGLEKYMFSPTARTDYQGNIPIETGGGKLANAEIISGRAKTFVADISGLHPMTMLTQIWGAKAMTTAIVENILELSKKFKTTDVFKKLDTGDIVRYRQLGWTEKEFNGIAKRIKEFATFEKGSFRELQLDKWDVESRVAYTVGLNRWINRVVQKNDIGSMNRWFTTDFGQLLVQFRNFSIVAYEKQLLNGLYTLSQTRGTDFVTYSKFLSSMIGASMFYATQIYINSIGMNNRKEYLDKHLSPQNLAKISFLRASWSTLIPAGLSQIHSLFSDEDLFGYGRNTGLSTDLIGGIPTVNLIDNTYSTIKMGAKLAFDPEYTPTQRDVKKTASLFALQNALVIKNINNMIVDKFVK
jgi:hypothetical protein